MAFMGIPGKFAKDLNAALRMGRVCPQHGLRFFGGLDELTGTDNAHAIVFPQRLVAVIVIVGMTGVAHSRPIYL
jgi:hypothetical protein